MGGLHKFMDENWIKAYMEAYNDNQELIDSLKDFSALVEMGITDKDKRCFFYTVENGRGVASSKTPP